MFHCMHLSYNFILLSEFMLHYLYYSPMSLLHFMSYNYSILDYMSMFHMSVSSYRMYMSLFIPLYFTHHPQMLLYMSHFILHYLVALHLFHYYSMSHFTLYNLYFMSYSSYLLHMLHLSLTYYLSNHYRLLSFHLPLLCMLMHLLLTLVLCYLSLT